MAVNRPLVRLALTDAKPLPRGPGHRTEATIAALDARNRLLREAASRFCNGSTRAAASMLHTTLARYHELGWRRDRSEIECPARHCGKVNELCWSIFKQRDAVPSIATVRRVLGRKTQSPRADGHGERETSERLSDEMIKAVKPYEADQN
jgi:hypothetical protein